MGRGIDDRSEREPCFIDARGDEALGSTWSFLDITPYGRQEEWENSPEDWPQTRPSTWGGWHDKDDHTL